jgi:NADH-quinone oxidoreductase subunit I
MTDDYELSSFTKEHLIYTPAQLAIKPKYEGDVELKFDNMGATHG